MAIIRAHVLPLILSTPCMGFHLPVPTKLSGDRFHEITPELSKPGVSIVFLPGTLVAPDEYTTVLEELGRACRLNGINANVYNTKFTGNAMHRWEVDDVSRDVIENIPMDNGLVVVGHSGGAFVAVDVAEKVGADCVVQWAGTLNSMGELPWDTRDPRDFKTPRYTILSEYDKRIPFLPAMMEFTEKRNDSFVTHIEGGTHFSGVRKGSSVKAGDKDRSKSRNVDFDTIQIAWKIAVFISATMGIGQEPRACMNYIQSDHNRTTHNFFGISKGQTRYELSKDIESMTKRCLGVPQDVTNFHHSVPGDMLLTFLYVSVPYARPVLHAALLYTGFLCSHPDRANSCSYSPLPDMNPFSILRSPPTWVKIGGTDPYQKNRARAMNSDVFAEALGSITPEQKRRYAAHGRKMRFGDDVVIPPIPGCGLAWIVTPLRLVLVHPGTGDLLVRSPVLNMGSRMNAKILSKTQCIEWITTSSFER